MPSDRDARRAGELVGTATLATLAAGAVGSAGLTLYAGLRIGSPRVLLVLFAGWVVVPFVILAAGYLLSRRGSAFVRLVYFGAVLAASLVSVGAYALAAFVPARPTTAVFVLAAPLSLLAVGLVVPIVVLTAGRRR
jgi:hypothetical protein